MGLSQVSDTGSPKLLVSIFRGKGIGLGNGHKKNEKIMGLSQASDTGSPKLLVSIFRGKGIGLGNGHKKNEKFAEFVLSKRQHLKYELNLCERATQKILCYSNNFLHKRLKTEEVGKKDSVL